MKSAGFSVMLAAASVVASPPHVFAVETVYQSTDKSVSNVLSQQEPLSEKKMHSMVNKPTTQIQVLENMKFALDHDLLLREDFYTDENLRQFFGIEDMSKDSGVVNPKDFWIRTNNFGDLFRQVESGGNAYSGAQMTLGIQANEIGKPRGIINFGISGAGSKPRELYFDDIEKVFGKKWMPVNNISLHGPPPPATGPHGNEDIKYTLDDASVKRSIVVGFYGDGSCSGAHITEEKK